MTVTEAARAAGYSAKTACESGCRLMKHPGVLRHIEKLKGQASAVIQQPVESVTSGGSAPEAPQSASVLVDDPKEYLLRVMNDTSLDDRLRADAAKALLPYVHPKLGEAGKKENKQEAAKAAGRGKFGASAPPRLAIVR